MFVRMTTVNGATDLDAGVAVLKKSVPELEGQKGFRGVSASGNRSTGNVGIISVWETLADLEASEGSVSKLRKDAVAQLGGQASVQVMEELLSDIGEKPPAEGCALRLFETTIEPARIDEAAEYFRSTVVPHMKASPGFRGTRNMIDRQTGKGFVGSIWADEAAMQADDERAVERRARSKDVGITLGQPIYRTILLSHFV